MAGRKLKEKLTVFRERLKMFVAISVILFPVHEIFHVIAQVIFGVPVSVRFYWYGVSTNENLVSLLPSRPIAFGTIVLAGFIGTLILMPMIKNLMTKRIFRDFEYYNEKFIYEIIFLLSAFSIAVWDIAIFIEKILLA